MIATDIAQSKVLAEILPIESADMEWVNTGYSWRLLTKNDEDAVNSTDIIHSWSLGALINVLPEKINEGTTDYARLEMGKDRVGYYRANGQTLFASMQDDLICDCFNIILELRRRNKQ